jgi:hypothetical protein
MSTTAIPIKKVASNGSAIEMSDQLAFPLIFKNKLNARNSHTMKNLMKTILFIAFCMIAMAGYAQKGVGEAKGVSQQQINPELLKMEGVIQQIKSGPCEHTTGRAVLGTHLMVKSQGKMVNIHLGPTSEIAKLFSPSEGDQITMTVFQTDKLPKDQFIAKEVAINGKSTVLRDDKLKPVWAGKNPKGKMRKRN